MTQFNAVGWPIRLSPSGPFIRDGVSNAPLLLGPGSLGIVLRAQGTSGAEEAVSSGTPTPVTGLSNIPCNLPVGYHYDMQVRLATNVTNPPGTPGPTEPVQAGLELSNDNGVTWTAMPPASRTNMVLSVDRGGMVTFEEVNVDLTAATLPITNIRVRPSNPGGTGIVTVQPGQCVVRVEQYIS